MEQTKTVIVETEDIACQDKLEVMTNFGIKILMGEKIKDSIWFSISKSFKRSAETSTEDAKPQNTGKRSSNIEMKR